MARRALVVGIDGYPCRPLRTCCNDAAHMASVLGLNADESLNWIVDSLLARDHRAPVVTRSDLLRELSELLTAEDDDVLFYFSGHAIRTPWGPELATQDGLRPGAGMSFSSLMTMINTSPAHSITVILDCCYSGDLGTELPGEGLGLADQDRSVLREDVVILASAHPNGNSEPAGELSVFTDLLVDGLLGGACDQRGRVTALGLYAHAWSAMMGSNAKPQFKANCAALPILRTSEAWVRLKTFRQLPRLFPTKDAELLFDPQWLTAHAEATTDQLMLAELHAARLAKSEEREPLGWVIRLNRPGRYYWRLVKRDLL